MKIKHGMILAAGLGKRMQPLTLETPKPLLKVGKQNLLERAINLLIENGVEEVVINIHHLGEQIKKFIEEKNYKINIKLSIEKDNLLDTGGGILKGTSSFNDNDPFIVINPDTLWNKNYNQELKNLIKLYFKEKKTCMLVVNKNISFDKSFNGDFTLSGHIISKEEKNQFIYTGLQIMNRKVFYKEDVKIFSMNKIWNRLIEEKKLLGMQSIQNFYHLNTLEMYKKISSLKSIDYKLSL
jgi:MurNAc alpha-1-phosphate uridylyltransferase|tara:strand:- start:354 stop:1070 length:717 start_codon:yes stop_codon:yes gene_type:complete